jgi:hypothetical protein
LNLEKTYVLLEYDGDTDLLLEIQWDRIPSGIKPLMCVNVHDRWWGMKLGTGKSLLILEADGDSHQRIGICALNDSWADVGSMNNSVLVQHRASRRYSIFSLLQGIPRGKGHDHDLGRSKLEDVWRRISTKQTLLIE